MTAMAGNAAFIVPDASVDLAGGDTIVGHVLVLSVAFLFIQDSLPNWIRIIK